MRQAQWLQGPEGKAHLYRQLTEQYAEELNGKRREVFGQELQQLLQHPQGRKIIEAALGDQRSAPGPEAELDSEMIDPGVRKMLLQQQQAIQQITQQNQQLAQQLQGLGQAHTSQALLQSSANELDGFVTANPVVMPFQRELAGDVYRAMQANPRAFAQRGAVTAFAKERATEYMRVARSMGAPVNGPPRGGPSGRGGQRGGLPALPAPKTEDEAVSQILTVYDSIRGGG
jgi:cell wall assembly regulator SMI1